METQNKSIIGINYEAGKIIDHILGYIECVAFANCQIAMDAPYDGRVADESVRSSGRSETLFQGYSEDYLINQLEIIFENIKIKYPTTRIVIQIARGRSAKPMADTIICPLLERLNITNIILILGYKTHDYFGYTTGLPDLTRFVFVNIGMFAVLENADKISVGQICNPTITYRINGIKDNKFDTDYNKTSHDTNKNLLSNYNNIPKIVLFGIDDNMPFITPDIYPKESINSLIIGTARM